MGQRGAWRGGGVGGAVVVVWGAVEGMAGWDGRAAAEGEAGGEGSAEDEPAMAEVNRELNAVMDEMLDENDEFLRHPAPSADAGCLYSGSSTPRAPPLCCLRATAQMDGRGGPPVGNGPCGPYTCSARAHRCAGV
jgi:hypothetical protein